MPLVLEKEKQLAVQNSPAAVLHVRMNEAVAVCPKCKAFQTVSFVGNKLVETRKFSQRDEQVYHDCGSNEPCRLYRGL